MATLEDVSAGRTTPLQFLDECLEGIGSSNVNEAVSFFLKHGDFFRAILAIKEHNPSVVVKIKKHINKWLCDKNLTQELRNKLLAQCL